jgi:hypothetical protein
MPRWLKKAIVVLLSAGAIFYVIYFTSPPNSWESASLLQIVIFFLPIIIGITALSDIFLKNIARSFVISLTVMFLLILESLYLFNIFTLTIIILCLAALLYIFNTPPQFNFKFARKIRPEKITKSLTMDEEIPKLTKFQQKRRQRRRNR